MWIALLAMADQFGIVHASMPGLARRARVTRKEAERAIEIFEAPDPDSRNPDHDGRRIEKVKGGWFVLNLQEYREIRTSKQVADAIRQQRIRDEHKRDVSRDDAINRGITTDTDTDTDTEAEAEAEAEAEGKGKRVIAGKEGSNTPTPSTLKNLPVKRDQHAVNKFIQSLSESSWARGRARKEAWVAFGFFGWRNSIKQRVLFHKQREDRTIKLIEAYGLVRVLLAIEGQRTHSDFNDVHGKNFRGYDNLFRAGKGFENIEKCSAEAIEHGRYEWTLRQLAGLSKKRGWAPGPLDVELFNQIQGNAE